MVRSSLHNLIAVCVEHLQIHLQSCRSEKGAAVEKWSIPQKVFDIFFRMLILSIRSDGRRQFFIEVDQKREASACLKVGANKINRN